MTKMIVLIYIEFSDIVEQITQSLCKYLLNFWQTLLFKISKYHKEEKRWCFWINPYKTNNQNLCFLQ